MHKTEEKKCSNRKRHLKVGDQETDPGLGPSFTDPMVPTLGRAHGSSIPGGHNPVARNSLYSSTFR